MTRLTPMLAKTAQSVDEVDSERWATEEKWDGWRLMVSLDADGVLYVVGGRNNGNYTGQLPYLEASLKRSLPPDTILDGEITAPAGFGSVQSRMTTSEPHRPSEAAPALTYRIFDVLRVNGTDVRSRIWSERRRLVEAIQLFEHMAITPILPTEQATFVSVVARGGEGVVLKHRNSRYVSTRSVNWLKIKHELTAEARVVGFKPGTPGSSWEGLVGAIEFELLEGGVRSRCSGFDMDLRRAMTSDPHVYMGRVFELKLFPGVGQEGKPRSPNFLRWRDDRMPPAVAPSREAVTAPVRKSPVKQPSRERSRMRNYQQMRTDKLAQCVRELETGQGDAFDRVVLKGGDPEADLNVAQAELAKRPRQGDVAA